MTDTRDAPSTDRFAVRVTTDSHFAWIRTRLSVENTMMAAERTAVSLIGFGFAIVQFFERLGEMSRAAPAKHPEMAFYLGLSLILCGVFVLVVALWQYHRTIAYLWRGSYAAIAGVSENGLWSPTVLVAVLLVCIGLFAFFAVLFRLV